MQELRGQKFIANAEGSLMPLYQDLVMPKSKCMCLWIGTGGTISGISEYLLPRLPNLTVVLADPQGSGLYNSIKYGVMYSPTEKEGTRRRHQVDSLVEGIGLNRLTKNFQKGQSSIHEAVKVTDAMAVGMGRWLIKNDGQLILQL
jgi:cysteine synthase